MILDDPEIQPHIRVSRRRSGNRLLDANAVPPPFEDYSNVTYNGNGYYTYTIPLPIVPAITSVEEDPPLISWEQHAENLIQEMLDQETKNEEL